MKRKTQLLFLPLLLLSLSLGFNSCKDNDLEAGGNGDDGKEIVTTEQDKYDALTRLLGAMADLDSLPDNWNSASFTAEPTLGVVTDASQPHVRSVVTNSVEEADRLYRSYTAQASTGAAKNSEWKMDGVGTMKFEVKNQADLYATLNVSVQQLPTLEEVRFVPASAIGDNGWLEPKGTFYQFGDVIKQTSIDGRETYWVCVRPCSATAKLRKTHWATFQLIPYGETDANFKKLNDQTYLPTKLCSKEDEGQRMVQNLFNVLRIVGKPSLYEQGKVQGIDGINITEFTPAMANAISNIWDVDGLWQSKVRNAAFDDDLARLMSGDNQSLRAFYYGYSKVWLGQGNYRVYNLDLSNDPTSQTNSTLFNQVTPSNPWVLLSNVGGNAVNRDFRAFENGFSQNTYIDSYQQSRHPNQFIVKCKSGAELEGSSGVDIDPSQSFNIRKDKNNIEDVLVSRGHYLDKDEPFFTIGDVVTKSSYFTGNQLCFLGDWSPKSTSAPTSVFICAKDGQFAEGKSASTGFGETTYRHILYQFYRAVDYNVFNNNADCPKMYAQTGDQPVELSQEEYATYKTMLTQLYTLYLKGNIKVDAEDHSIIAKVAGKTYKLSYNAEGKGNNKYILVPVSYEVEGLTNINIVGIRDEYHYVDDFSADRTSRTFGIRGLSARRNLKLALNNDFLENLGN